MSDGSGESTYKYDQLDRMSESKDGHGDAVKYEYNLANEPTKITYPNGKAISRAYDKDDRLQSVEDWNKARPASPTTLTLTFRASATRRPRATSTATNTNTTTRLRNQDGKRLRNAGLDRLHA